MSAMRHERTDPEPTASELPAEQADVEPADVEPADVEGPGLEAEQVLARERANEIATWGWPFSDWVPPSLGPLPEELRERAARLLQHQLAVAERLVERITQSQKQRDVAARMSHGPERPGPAYIDQSL